MERARLLFSSNKKPIWSWEAQRSFEGSQYKANNQPYWDGWCGEGWARLACMEMRLQKALDSQQIRTAGRCRILMPEWMLDGEALNHCCELEDAALEMVLDLVYSLHWDKEVPMKWPLSVYEGRLCKNPPNIESFSEKQCLSRWLPDKITKLAAAGSRDPSLLLHTV